MNDEIIAGLLNKFNRLMNEEHFYMNPDASISLLATIMKTNPGYLSKLINQEFVMNFNEYINQLRIIKICKLMEDENSRNLPLTALAHQAGFRSRSVFYDSFRKFCGSTPSVYRNKTAFAALTGNFNNE
jgi:AraC-like DNA-binding protein